MKICSFKFLLIFSGVLLPSNSALSQNNSISDYVPPPLFGAPPKASPSSREIDSPKKRSDDAKIIELRKNDNQAPSKNEATNLKKLKELRALKEKTSAFKTVPLPKKKPIMRDKVNNTEPPKTEEQKIIRNTEGVVKGPKTMPAVKKRSVEAEVLEGPSSATIKTDMLARVQSKENSSEERVPITQKSKPKQAATLLKDRLVLVFQPSEAILSDSKRVMLLEQVVPVLANNANKRLNITAYASPDADNMNADKRLALSRGLAVRSYLLRHNVSPSQLNVRSLGSDTQQQPYDRVEIELIN